MVPENFTIEQGKAVLLKQVRTTGCPTCGRRVPLPVKNMGGVLVIDPDRAAAWCDICGRPMCYCISISRANG
jgi:hypothetical protein